MTLKTGYEIASRGSEGTLSDQFLDKVLANHSPSHAYLFFGPASSEKEIKAKIFCKTLLCPRQKEKPCEECVSCKKIDSGNHPDFREIHPDGEPIKIGEIRFIKEESRYAPLEGDWKFYLFSKAERLTEEAAQSMLKILEEPPTRTVFILTAIHPTGLLPTIASRCQRIPFSGRGGSFLRNEFVQNHGLSPEMAAILSALEVPASEAAHWNSLVTEASPVLFSEIQKPQDLFAKGAFLEDYKEQGKELIDLLLAFYRDVAVAKSGWDQGIIFTDFASRSRSLAEKLSWGEIWEKSKLILDAGNHFEYSGNFRLLVENLLWKLRA